MPPAPNPAFSVRAARPADASRMGAVQVAAWRVTHRALLGARADSLDPARFAAAWADAIALAAAPPAHHAAPAADDAAPPVHGRPAAPVVLAATATGSLVGFAAVAPSGDPDAAGRCAEIVALEVDPPRRRAGHGSRLLAAAAAAARDAWGAAEVRIWVTAGDQARARFLASAGFTPVSRSRPQSSA
ncbi:MAG: GNAT family N-acetyltransferase, partial [Bifidobacteriaceae bacterium]|nr:GNAT family N-acetyltransferase [Bifidobacteriaceae bacterium]